MSAPQWVVLFVDDDPINVRVFEANFASRYNLVCARSGEEALEVIQKQGRQIAVVLTDQKMGAVSGVDLLERARVHVPDAGRFLVTAYSDVQVVLDAVNRGQAQRYFIKPWSPAEVQQAIDDVLSVHAMRERLRTMESLMLQSERLATIGQVTAGIAHELMNPLAFVSQNIESLARDMRVVDPYLKGQLAQRPDAAVSAVIEDLPALLSDVQQGLEMIRSVAVSVRAQARGSDGEVVADLAEVATFAVRLAQPQFGHTIRLTRQGNPVRVQASPVKLCQVLLNLLVNAAHACGELDRPSSVKLRWEAEGDPVQIAVEDTGPGMPADVAARAFEPLFTTKAPGKGTGLGLSICRELITEMGGEIALDSTVGVGTRVTVKLSRA